MNDENKHYRYCFQCDKWLTKEEVNEIDWGPQPGGEMGKCWHCSHCRKQVGDDSQTQIFRCKKHNDEILKVWGVLDGENKQKIFYEHCPQEQTSSFWNKLPMPVVIGSIATFLLGLLVVIKVWWSKKSQKIEDKLKNIKDSISKKKEEEVDQTELDNEDVNNDLEIEEDETKIKSKKIKCKNKN